MSDSNHHILRSLVDETDMQGIYQRDGKWGFRANVPGSGGKQVRRGGYPSQDAAFQARVAFLHGNYSGVRSVKMTVGDWLTDWLAVIAETMEPTTYENYDDVVRLYLMPLLGPIPLQVLDETMIREAYRKMVTAGYSTNTIKGVHRRLSAALNAAKRERKIAFAPTANVTPPKGKAPKARVIWDQKQAGVFARHVLNRRDAAMWLTFLGTGARRGELLRLRWPDIDLDADTLNVRKAKTDAGVRIIPLNARLVEVLRRWKAIQAAERLGAGRKWQGEDFVFTSSQRRFYNLQSPAKELKKICEDIGVPVLSPHKIRHTFATMGLVDSMDIKVLSEILGHASVVITRDLYQQVPQETARKAIDSLGDRLFG